MGTVDFEYLAEQTHGYSGADLSGISKVAAKLAIRGTIAAQVARLKAIEAGDIDEDEEEEDAVPLITMDAPAVPEGGQEVGDAGGIPKVPVDEGAVRPRSRGHGEPEPGQPQPARADDGAAERVCATAQSQ